MTALSGSIPAGGRYLVQLASGGVNGAALPTADATGTSNLAATGGKVAIVDSATALACGDSAGSCSSSGSIEDFAGYGSAADYEGSDAAPAPSATTAIARAGGGCTDSDDNAADFATGAPNPLNSSTAAAACSGSGGGGSSPGDADVTVDVQPAISIALDHPTLSFPAAVPGTAPAPLPEHVTVTSNDPSGYTLGVHRTTFVPHDLPLGIGVGSGSLPAVPIAPAPDLLLATTSSASAASGDIWNTSVGFVSPLPVVPAGHYAATLTYTVIGRPRHRAQREPASRDAPGRVRHRHHGAESGREGAARRGLLRGFRPLAQWPAPSAGGAECYRLASGASAAIADRGGREGYAARDCKAAAGRCSRRPPRARTPDHAAARRPSRPAAAARRSHRCPPIRGRIVRRLDARSLTIRRAGSRRMLELLLVNRGNVTERLGDDRLRLQLLRPGRVFATLRPRGRELLPRSAGFAEFAYRGRVRGDVLARVYVRPVVHGPRRSFRVHL